MGVSWLVRGKFAFISSTSTFSEAEKFSDNHSFTFSTECLVVIPVRRQTARVTGRTRPPISHENLVGEAAIRGQICTPHAPYDLVRFPI
jgi:hypothetical protein